MNGRRPPGGALAAARDHARINRLRANEADLSARLADVHAELQTLGAAPAAAADAVPDELWLAATEAGAAEARTAARVLVAGELAAATERARLAEADRDGARRDLQAARRRCTTLATALVQLEAAPPAMPAPDGGAAWHGAGWHDWLRDRARGQGDEAAALHRLGVSGPELGRRYGCSSTVVYGRMTAAGYQARTFERAARARWRLHARALVECGLTRTAAAAAVGVDRTTLTSWARRFELAADVRMIEAADAADAAPAPPEPERRLSLRLAPELYQSIEAAAQAAQCSVAAFLRDALVAVLGQAECKG